MLYFKIEYNKNREKRKLTEEKTYGKHFPRCLQHRYRYRHQHDPLDHFRSRDHLPGVVADGAGAVDEL